MPATREPAKPRSLRRVVLLGCAIGLVLATTAEAAQVLLGRNFHTVVAGAVYRSSQPSPERIERLIESYGIRTVVNMRGCCNPLEWYVDECRVTHNLDVAQEDVCLSAGRLPSVHEMRRLVEVIDNAEYPVLIHCNRGSDRTGLAAAVLLLLRYDVPLDTARRQLALRYGHLALGHPGYLDEFFDLYAEWLQVKDKTHTRANFRQWIEDDYCPGECRCRIELTDEFTTLPRGKPIALHIRAHNISVRAWQLRAGGNAGVHATFALCDPDGIPVTYGRTGLFEAVVPPGQSIDLIVPVPALQKAGKYRLFVDMVAEQHCEFYKTGSEPLYQELEVRDSR
jgi:protein tyrosine phosphatase (PTP) superfamily phosphohydrolase (DUF442 family)